MSIQNSNTGAFAVQPPRNDLGLTVGFIEVFPAVELCINRNGAVWLYERDAQFEILEAAPEGSGTRVWGAVPIVVDPGSQWEEPVIAMASTSRVIPTGAWLAAQGVLVGPMPTPLPPMPPLVDLRVA